jgi:hypothetical protein
MTDIQTEARAIAADFRMAACAGGVTLDAVTCIALARVIEAHGAAQRTYGAAVYAMQVSARMERRARWIGVLSAAALVMAVWVGT